MLNSASFLFIFSFSPYLLLTLWIPSERLLTIFNNELAINLVLSINCNMEDILFVIPSPFSSILVSSFSIVTVNVMFFSVFSPKQVIGFLKFLCQLFYDKVIIIVKSIMKNYKKVFRHTIFSIKYAMHSTTIFPV